MVLKNLKVYHYFWITAVLIILIGIFRESITNNSLDINIHDTYLVIANFDVTILLTVAYTLLGTGYWIVEKLLNRKLIKALTIINTVIFLGSFLMYWLAYLYALCNPSYLFDSLFSTNVTLIISLLLILFIGLPVYFINLLIAIIRNTQIDKR